ncbi:hypothetical protein CC1G_14866 [Coprinopsis cinerea okayama7|uniref:Uncharacterized protein n=1 Tax=Coprinopsis cinerea (strain Okayama-7 / 130 / ATCC MYA-4618 / FGSC 9003) TaxID=240176 RepID=D6RNX1_COPC7|nr:hypothetical protein CC1G_14866 [Coprinopsis cinerea okayama7\|eukprot:XP_002910889.1 hypothetical protein CC1G_14866 [Coprinopsis cinerea okayama7\
MKFSDTAQFSSAILGADLQLPRAWIKKALSAFERKNPGYVSLVFEDTEEATLDFQSIPPIVGADALREFHEWLFKAILKAEFSVNSAHLLSTQIIFHVEGTFHFLEEEPQFVSWMIAVDKRPQDSKARAMTVYGQTAPFLAKCQASAGSSSPTLDSRP